MTSVAADGHRSHDPTAERSPDDGDPLGAVPVANPTFDGRLRRIVDRALSLVEDALARGEIRTGGDPFGSAGPLADRDADDRTEVSARLDGRFAIVSVGPIGAVGDPDRAETVVFTEHRRTRGTAVPCSTAGLGPVLRAWRRDLDHGGVGAQLLHQRRAELEAAAVEAATLFGLGWTSMTIWPETEEPGMIRVAGADGRHVAARRMRQGDERDRNVVASPALLDLLEATRDAFLLVADEEDGRVDVGVERPKPIIVAAPDAMATLRILAAASGEYRLVP